MSSRRLLTFLILALYAACSNHVLSSKPTHLLFANRKDIRIVSVGSTRSNSSVVIGHLEEAAALDFYFAENIIFWTDIGLEMIKGVQINGTTRNEFTVISTGVISPDGLACDWLTKKLYWTDTETNRIEVSEFNGNNRKVLFYDDLDQPRAIALAPSDGLMFWTDWGETPKIERASMDGNPTTRKLIVKDNIMWPNGLTIDYDARLVYWADAKLKFIAVMDYEGNNMRTVVQGDLPHPFAITILGEYLYWTDWGTYSVNYCNKNNPLKRKTVVSGNAYSPMGIQVFSALRQLPKSTPCNLNNGGCSHLCLLSPRWPYYSCACPTGVLLLNDNKTCADGAEKSLLLARRVDIRRISLDTNDHTDVVLPLKGIKHAVAVDFDPVDKRIYWTDDDVRLIRRAFINGTHQEDIVSTEVYNPDGVAIDWIARYVYWTDTGTDRIEVAYLDGSFRKILITEGLYEPRAIAVHPSDGRMYWTDWGTRPKIERAALDGTEREVIVNTSLVWPNGLAIDYKTNHLYWSDAKLDKIEMSDLQGRDRRELVSDQLPHIFGFTVLDDHVYWTDWQRRSIERVQKLTGGDREVILDQIPDVMGLKAVSSREEFGTNPCAPSTSTCSHFCFNKPLKRHVCACPVGFELKSDGKTCVVPEAFLLFSKKTDIKRISLESQHLDLIPISGVQDCTAFAYDVQDQRIYWADSKSKRISRAFINGSNVEHVVEFGIEHPNGLAVDWISHNIYWTDSSRNRIEVSSLVGPWRKTVIWKDVERPNSLALDPLAGFMYWADWALAPKIEKAGLDGYKRSVLVANVGRPHGLTVDLEHKQLYWTDMDSKTIEVISVQGGRRRIIIKDLRNPFGLTVYRDFVYWSDLQRNSIERANKNTGDNRTVVKDGLVSVTDLVVFHTSRQSGWNPCAVNNGGCSHLCLTTPAGNKGSNHRCACPTHYTLSTDDKICIAPPRFLLYSQKSLISRMVPDANDALDVVLPIENLKSVKAITYDAIEQDIYWIDGRFSIRKVKQDGTKGAILLPNSQNIFAPHDFVLDPYSRLLYWSCTQTDTINVTRLDGYSIGPLFNQNDKRRYEKPRALALHLKKGFLFWINAIAQPTIMRSLRDGRDITEVVGQLLEEPITLAVDAETDKLYWADTGLKRIELCDINGANRRTLVSELLQPSALAIMGNFLYWLDVDQKLMARVDKLTGGSYQAIHSKIPYLTDLVVAEPIDMVPSIISCKMDNGGCSHICLYSVEGHQCACPHGLTLSSDGKNCVSSPTCSAEQFACVSGKTICIPHGWKCDGTVECEDKSDELNCPNCQAHQYRCPKSSICLEPTSVCDNTPDCPDGSDEQCCTQDEFRCFQQPRTCIPAALVCNGNRDCDDGSDEAPESCHKVEVNSSSGLDDYGSNYSYGVLIAGAFMVAAVGVTFCVKRNKSDVKDCEVGVNDMLMDRSISRSDRVTGSRKPVGASSSSCPVAPKLGVECTLERGKLTGASSSSSSTGRNYPKETINPPPSPVTDQSCCSSAAQSRYSRTNILPSSSRRFRRSFQKRGPPPTPCSTDANEESEPYPYRIACYNNSQADINYDSDPYPPPPTPRSHYFSDVSPPPSPFTERSYCNPYPPPPSPIN